jgi:hypothetical protein
MKRNEIAKEICGRVNECGKVELNQWQGCLECVRYTEHFALADWIQEKWVERKGVEEVVREMSDTISSPLHQKPLQVYIGLLRALLDRKE